MGMGRGGREFGGERRGLAGMRGWSLELWGFVVCGAC